MPDISGYDNESDWMHDCVPTHMDEGKPQDQAVAICMSQWREKAAKATWDTAYVNDLPDSAFLFVESGDKDEQGKTVPRSKRHFPYKDAGGKVDLPHLRNAIARIPQSNAPGLSPDKKRQLQDRARKFLENASKDEKAGRRLRSDWAKKLKDLKDAFTSWLKDVDAMEAWANYADEPEAKAACPCPRTFKAADGKTWLLTWTTNAFKDRDGELFSTKSIEDYVARHEGDEKKGRFQFWHLPGTDFGDIRWQATVGRFLVEAGPFDDTPLGEKFKAFYEAHPEGHPTHAPNGWATSHGYSYKEGDRADGVYDWFEKYETSLLPFEAAANQHNPQPEVITMNDKQKALLREIGGDELVKAVLETGEAQTKALEEQGIAYKANEEPTAETTQSVAAEPTPAPVDVKAIADQLHLVDLSDAIAAMQAGLKGLSDKMTAIEATIGALKKADEVKVAEKLADTPRFSWFRASQAAATVLDDSKPEDAALKTRKATPAAIANIAARMSEQHGG